MRKSDIAEPGFKRYAVAVLIGSLAGIMLSLVLLLPISAIVLAGIVDEGLSVILLILTVLAGSLFGGILAARRLKSKAIPIGLVTGIVMFLWLCVIGLLFYDRFLPTENGLGLLLASVAGGLLGGKLTSPGRGSSGRGRSRR